MANSKSDDKAPKTMDIMQPGMTAPPATSRPIIVSSRPILRQDPMMVSPDGMEKPQEPTTRTNISRVGKTLTVLAPSQSKTAKAATIAPLSDLEKAQANAPESAPAPDKPAAGPMPQGRTPEEIATKKAIAVKTDDAPAESIASAALAATSPVEAAAPPSEPTSASPKPAEPAATAPEATANKPQPSPMPAAPQAAATSMPGSTPSTALSTEDDISAETDAGPTTSEPVNSPDGQLAPNKTIDEAKKKTDDIEAARQAEQEQIIASRRYNLPIASADARRGVGRSLIVLLLVLVLAAVWLDVVLDAGVVHLWGLHPLTHFFK